MTGKPGNELPAPRNLVEIQGWASRANVGALLLTVTVLAIIDLALIIWHAISLGAWITTLIVIGSSLTGAGFYLRQWHIRTRVVMSAYLRVMDPDQSPSGPTQANAVDTYNCLCDIIFFSIGAGLVLIPGVVTDIIAVVLLIPRVRAAALPPLRRRNRERRTGK